MKRAADKPHAPHRRSASLHDDAGLRPSSRHPAALPRWIAKTACLPPGGMHLKWLISTRRQ